MTSDIQECQYCGKTNCDLRTVQIIPGTTAWMVLCRECRIELFEESEEDEE